MKNTCAKIFILALLGAAGCASPSKVSQLPGVGPTPSLAAPNATVGFLQVYSAREQLPININGEVFFANNDYGRNDFRDGTAHTDYSLYSKDGELLLHVPNARGMNDADPTRLKLAPATYQVRAEAADSDGAVSTIMVPVCVEPGQTTLVHLDGNWYSRTTGTGDQWVRLADGTIVGWHCSDSEVATIAFRTSN
jgi:hypothetical protein